MRRAQLFLALLLILSCKPKHQAVAAPTSTDPNRSGIKLIAEKYDVIWGFDFINSTNILFTEKKGRMSILDTSSYGVQPVQGLPKILVDGQGGLLDVALHPDFAKNKWVYFSYAVEVDGKGETRVTRARLNGTKLENLEVLFTSNSKSREGRHFGSRIVFDHEGHIFFSVGERGIAENAQDLKLANGKIHRLMEDGKIPTDNPFVNNKEAVPSIWSYGHRNPQGLYYDVTTKTLWEQEHGPKGGDEINIVLKGKNYGWPVITYGIDYSGAYIGPEKKEGMEQPIYYFVPSIAPSGLTMHKGNLYSGALALQHLNRLVMDGKKVVREERLLEQFKERIRDVQEGPDGLLYFSTDSGKIFQLTLS